MSLFNKYLVNSHSVKSIVVEPVNDSEMNKTRSCPPRVHSQLKERVGGEREAQTVSLQGKQEPTRKRKVATCYENAEENRGRNIY